MSHFSSLKHRSISFRVIYSPTVRLLFWWFSWVVIVLLGLLIAARIFWFDAATPLVWANEMTLHIYLPAYGIAFAAWRRRHWSLGVVATAVTLFHLWLIAPGFLHLSRWQQAETNPDLRLFSMNLTDNNSKKAWAVVREIESLEPDILFFQEYTPVWQEGMQKAGLFDTYPFGLADEESQPYGTAIWSKYPLTMNYITLDDILVIQAFAEVKGQTIEFFNLHLPPLINNFSKWDERMATVTETLLQTNGLSIVIGDYNQTRYNRWYQTLTNGRFRDAHQLCGSLWAATWPNGTLFLPGLLLDHALLSPGITCVKVWEGAGAGSEHKPIIIDIILPNQ